jgi:MFS family permease
MTFLTYGLGMFVGSWLSGLVVGHYALAVARGTVTYDWRSIWLFSAGSAAVVLVFFLFTFHDRGGRVEDVPVVSDDDTFAVSQALH